MRILFSSMALPGHLTPVLPYATALRDQGHDVRVCTSAKAAEKLRKAGLDHVPGPDITMDELIVAFAGTEGLSEDEKDAITIPRVFVELAARKAMPTVQETITAWQPDLIVRESCEFAALVAAEKARIPHVRIAILHCDMEKKFGALSAAAVDGLRVSVGLTADRAASLIAEPVFTAFPKALGETRVASHAPEPMRVAMPLEVVSQADPRPSWVPTNGEHLVYVTFGTQSGTTDRERAMYRTALDAVAELPVRVLLTTGPNMAEHPLGPIPSNVVVETFVPQAQVFQHAKAVVTHGGSGTVLGALAVGLPLVVAPMFADQPDNARAVAATGAGVAVFDADVLRLRSGIERVTRSNEFSKSAQSVADEMTHMPDLEQAILKISKIASQRTAL